MAGEFVQPASNYEKNRDGCQADKQWKFSADRAPKRLRVFRVLNCIRFCRHAPEHIDWA